MKKIQFTAFICVTVLAIMGTVVGCGVKQDLLAEMTGTWQSKSENDTIGINLTGDPKTIAIGGRVVPVTVKNIKRDIYAVVVNTKDHQGNVAEWRLREIWNDTGSEFTIEFRHDRKKQILTRVEG